MYRLQDARLKIRRAREHLQLLNTLIAAYFARRPYVTFREYDPHDPAEYGIRGIGLTEEPPAGIALVAGDCVQNLRATLDYIAHELVATNGREPTSRTSFPIFRYGRDYERARSRIDLGNIPAADLASIEQVQPFHRGENAGYHPLWQLHELSNSDKHRRLYITALYVTGADQVDWALPGELVRAVGLATRAMPSKGQGNIACTFWFPLAVPSNTDMDMYLKGSLFVALDEKVEPRGVPIQYLLSQILEFLESDVIPLFSPPTSQLASDLGPSGRIH